MKPKRDFEFKVEQLLDQQVRLEEFIRSLIGWAMEDNGKERHSETDEEREQA